MRPMNRKIKLEKYLESHTQAELGALFGRSQPWAAHILKKHPEARLLMEKGEVVAIEYSNRIVKYRV